LTKQHDCIIMLIKEIKMIDKVDVKKMEDRCRQLCEHAEKMRKIAEINLELSKQRLDLFVGYKL
jgi:hypothetical protein